MAHDDAAQADVEIGGCAVAHAEDAAAAAVGGLVVGDGDGIVGAFGERAVGHHPSVSHIHAAAVHLGSVVGDVRGVAHEGRVGVDEHGAVAHVDAAAAACGGRVAEGGRVAAYGAAVHGDGVVGYIDAAAVALGGVALHRRAGHVDGAVLGVDAAAVAVGMYGLVAFVGGLVASDGGIGQGDVARKRVDAASEFLALVALHARVRNIDAAGLGVDAAAVAVGAAVVGACLVAANLAGVGKADSAIVVVDAAAVGRGLVVFDEAAADVDFAVVEVDAAAVVGVGHVALYERLHGACLRDVHRAPFHVQAAAMRGGCVGFDLGIVVNRGAHYRSGIVVGDGIGLHIDAAGVVTGRVAFNRNLVCRFPFLADCYDDVLRVYMAWHCARVIKILGSDNSHATTVDRAFVS